MGSIALIPKEIKQAVPDWKKEIEERRKVTTIDPVADAMAYCAGDLEERIKKAEAAGRSWTTREYARLHGVRDATVRKWIKAGELEANLNVSGDWEIPRSAIHHRKQVKPRARA